jgi:hypothetical protein
MTTLMRRAGRYIVIGAAVTASSFYEVNELNHTVSQSVKLVSYDEDQLVVLDSVGTVCDVATETGPPCSSFQDGAVEPYTVAPLLRKHSNQSSVVDTIAFTVRSEAPKPDI